MSWMQEDEEERKKMLDYSDLTDFERAIHRGFLCAGVENVPVIIIKETAEDCLINLPTEKSEPPSNLDELLDDYFENLQVPDHQIIFEDTFRKIATDFYGYGRSEKPNNHAEWSEEDEEIFNNIIEKAKGGHWIEVNEITWLVNRFKSPRPQKKED